MLLRAKAKRLSDLCQRAHSTMGCREPSRPEKLWGEGRERRARACTCVLMSIGAASASAEGFAKKKSFEGLAQEKVKVLASGGRAVRIQNWRWAMKLPAKKGCSFVKEPSAAHDAKNFLGRVRSC